MSLLCRYSALAHAASSAICWSTTSWAILLAISRVHVTGADSTRRPPMKNSISVGRRVFGLTRMTMLIPRKVADQLPVFSPCLHTSLHFRLFRQFCQCRNLSRSFFQVTPQTISNWLYRRKRPSLDKYLALDGVFYSECSYGNAATC